MSVPPLSERKTRRAHKNSRDGCPECKKRRIKCREELPQCHNCVRKNLRCGYLDLPQDKLQALQEKNDLKKRQASRELSSILSPAPSATSSSKPSEPGSKVVEAYVPVPVPLYDAPEVTAATTPGGVVTPIEPPRLASEWPYSQVPIGSPMAVYLNHSDASSRPHYPPQLPDYPEVSTQPQSQPQPQLQRQPQTRVSGPQSPPVVGSPLPNVIATPVSFRPHRKLAKRLRLDPVMVTVDPYQPSLSRFITVHENYEAVWSNDYRKLYWRVLYEVAMKLEVYWTFFIDRSLNVLLNECNYFMSSRLPNDDGRVSHFTSKDLQFLLKRSYIYYGRLIRNLRTSIDHLHIEYPTKISLFAAWSTFLHPHSQHEVLRTMYGGTILLVTKIATESTSLSQITPTIRTMIQLLYTRISGSMIPDYPITLFGHLRDVFYSLRSFLEDREYVVGGVAVPKYQRIKFAGLLRFVDEFINEVFPAIQYLDTHYRPQLVDGQRDPGSVLVVSAKQLFVTCVRWFQIFANESLSVGSRMPLISRIIYLCFSATARAMGNIVPTLPALLLVEPFNLMAAETEFNAKAYEVTATDLAPEEFEFLHFVSAKLSRMITYLKLRNDSYIYTTYSRPVPIEGGIFNVINNVDHDRTKSSYTDITYIQAPKIYGGEVLPWSPDHSQCRLTIDHYPFLSEAARKYGWQHLVDQEIERSNAAVEHSPHLFDYSRGLFVDDFDARELVSLYTAQQHKELTETLTLENVRKRVDTMNISRAAMEQSVFHNL